MASIIDLSKIELKEKVTINHHEAKKEVVQPSIIPSDTIADNEEFLRKEFPNKILFSIEEATSILNMSYEFIRSSIIKGRINAKRFGKKHLIHLKELSKIITQGV
ncbi:MAG: hypothetical protein V1720_03585 [bacterium]